MIGGERSWRHLLYVAPFLVFFLGLLVYPLLAGLSLSFDKADLFGAHQFIGVENYRRLLHDEVFLGAVRNTLYFLALTVPALTVIGLALALALNRAGSLAMVLRGVFFASSVLSVTIVTLLWRVMLSPGSGLLAGIARIFGREPVAFLNDPRLALPAIAVTTIWWCLGLPMMLFLAALQQLPPELLEAAALDSAGRWRTLWSITLPSIRRTFVLVLIIEIVLQFQLFGQAQLMTRGGPNNSSRPIVLFIYETGFNRWDVGYASAASQALFLLILAAAMGQYWVTRRDQGAS